MRLAPLALILLCAGCRPAGEAIPAPQTDVWLVELQGQGDVLDLGTPVNLTARDGYDNQPAFLPDGSGFLYASGDGEQVDIWLWDFAAGAARPLTRTTDNEYSPAPIPGDTGFSAVRVEATEDADQRLWRFDADGANPALLIEWEDSVQYYAWIDPHLVALRVEGDPDELTFADTSIGWVEEAPVARSVGRQLAVVPGGNALTFVHKVSNEQWWIKQLDLLTREVFDVIETLPGCEDFAWTPDGQLLAARQSRIYAYTPGREGGWVEVADLAPHGVGSITRMAVDPAGVRLLLVVEQP